MDDNDTRVRGLVAAGSEATGAAAGGVLGFLLGGPVGAAAGGAAGVVISKSLSEFANRALSHREAVRVGAVTQYAFEGIKRRLDEGRAPRDDSFFASDTTGRSSAEELLEGVLQKGRNEHEEKKLRLLGHFWAELAFAPWVSVGEANHLLRVAESLSYRQICLLALIARKGLLANLKLEAAQLHKTRPSLSYDAISLLQEAFEMYNRGLMLQRTDNPQSNEALLGWADVVPDKLSLAPAGERLAMLLGVNNIEDSDVSGIVQQLSVQPTVSAEPKDRAV